MSASVRRSAATHPGRLAMLLVLFTLPVTALQAYPARSVDRVHAAPRGVYLTHAQASVGATVAGRAVVVPSFSRQTGLACGACHFQFLQLTPFGRTFKLNGYTMTGIRMIGAGRDSTHRETLSLASVPPISAMVIASVSHVAKTPDGTQNGGAALPQEASIFIAGAIAPKLGAFLQYTYSGDEGSFGVDNVDIRFASHATLASRDLLYGVTLHNNPTVQDVWNTSPVWGWPFNGSGQTPASIASPVLAGAFAQKVLGIGAYGLWNQTLYGEVTLYRSALQGHALPLDSSASGVLKDVAPYWRMALQRDVGGGHVTVGTYGITSHVFGSGVTGLSDQFTDVAGDAQYESRVAGDRVVVVRGNVIHERRTLSSLFASGGTEQLYQRLTSLQASVSFQPSATKSATLGVFSTTGTRDRTLFAAEEVTGSSTGSPETAGLTGEVTLNPWQNARLGLQYTAFTRFNGASTNYDGAGRRARDNNTLYLFTWLVF